MPLADNITPLRPSPADDVLPELFLENQVCLSLYRTTNSLTRLYTQAMKPLGITYPQFLCMLALWQKAPRTVTEISLAIDLGKATITPLLLRLEAQGLITRDRDSLDERRVNVRLTERGRALREPVADARRRLICSLSVSLSEVYALKLELDKLHGILSDAAPLPDAA